MKANIKKIVALLLVFTLILALAGCGKTTPADKDEQNNNSTTAPSKQEEPTSTPKEDDPAVPTAAPKDDEPTEPAKLAKRIKYIYSDSECYTKEEYEYNLNGNEIRITEYYISEGNKILCFEMEIEYEYDSNGEIIGIQSSRTVYDVEGDASIKVSSVKVEREYDSAGNVVHLIQYDMTIANMDGEHPKTEWFFVYDGDKLVEEKKIVGSCERITEYKYEYDSEGRMTKKIIIGAEWFSFEGDELKPCTTTEQYDVFGNCIESITLFPDGTVKNSNKYRFEYDFDSNGNMIKTIKYDTDGAIDYIEEYLYY